MDIAINDPSSDKLARWGFAKSLATQIWELPRSDEGFVIGLESEWGSGKSSVINLTLHHLLHLELAELSAVPSYYGDNGERLSLDQLNELAQEYRDIVGFQEADIGDNFVHPDHYNRAIAATHVNDETRAKQIYRYFRLRMRAKSDPRILVVHFRPWLIPDTAALSTVFIAELAKSVGGMLGGDVEAALKGYSDVMSKFAPIAGVAAQAMIPGIGSLIKDFFISLGSRPDPTLESRKTNLEHALRRLIRKKILVIIDDLDRLSPKEATEMVGLVKSLGNLPNVVYLLSYDSTVLTAHIKEVLKINGDAYLEKIVQYRRSLPLLSSGALWRFFTVTFDSMFENVTEEILRRRDAAMINVAKRYIHTPRDAIRCSSWALQAHKRLAQQTDPVDLLVLEIANAKDPSFYRWIRQNIDELCAPQSEVSVESLSKSLQSVSLEQTDVRTAVLAFLFPSAAAALDMHHIKSISPRAAKRLHVREFSPAYFELSEPLTSFGKDALHRLLFDEDGSDELGILLDRAEQSNYASSMRIDLLEAMTERFQTSEISRAFLKDLIENSARLIELEDRVGDDVSSPDNWRRISSLTEVGLRKWDHFQKETVLSEILAWSPDISLACDIIFRWWSLSAADNGASREAVSDDTREYVLRAIRRRAEANEIHTFVRSEAVLRLWSDLDDASEVRKYIDKVIAQGDRVDGVCRFLLDTGRSSEEGLSYRLSLNADKYADLKLLEQWAMNSGGGMVRSERLWAERMAGALGRRRDSFSLL